MVVLRVLQHSKVAVRYAPTGALSLIPAYLRSAAHIHIHIIPRYYNDKMHGFFWPRKRYSDEQAKNVQDLIIKKLGDINEYKQR